MSSRQQLPTYLGRAAWSPPWVAVVFEEEGAGKRWYPSHLSWLTYPQCCFPQCRHEPSDVLTNIPLEEQTLQIQPTQARRSIRKRKSRQGTLFAQDFFSVQPIQKRRCNDTDEKLGARIVRKRKGAQTANFTKRVCRQTAAYEIHLERESNSPVLLRPLRKPAWQQLWVPRTPTRMNSDGLQLEAICTYYLQLPLVVYRLKSLYTFCLNTLLLPYLLVLMVFFPNKKWWFCLVVDTLRKRSESYSC